MPDAYENLLLPSGRQIAFRGRLTGESGKLMLFVHGLGHDSTAWEDWTEDDEVFAGWDLMAPDLPGFGGTDRPGGGGSIFTESARLLLEIIRYLAPEQVVLVLHSMGGVIGTMVGWSLLAAQGVEVPEAWAQPGGILPVPLPLGDLDKDSKPPRLLGVVNIEGNLTSSDIFISGKAISAEENGRFDRWFSGIIEAMVRSGQASDTRYASALLASDRKAFLAASRELVAWSDSEEGEDAAAGRLYKELPVPTLYIGGGESLPELSAKWLKASDLYHRVVPNAGHAVMNDRPDEVAREIEGFLQGK